MYLIRLLTKLLLLLLLIACKVENTKNRELFSFNLKTLNSEEFSLHNLDSNKASVFIFLGSECPMCQNYSLTLNKLYNKFKTKNINFYGIFSGKNSNYSEIMSYTEIYKNEFQILRDQEKQLCAFLSAKVTPEVFVVDRNGEVLYQGSIDNWLYELGRKRSVITENYLDDALMSIISDIPVKIKQTEAKGCLIE